MVNRSVVVLSGLLAAAVAAADTNQEQVEYPDVFDRRGTVQHCDNNAVIASWCDSRVLTDLECGVLPEFDE